MPYSAAADRHGRAAVPHDCKVRRVTFNVSLQPKCTRTADMKSTTEEAAVRKMDELTTALSRGMAEWWAWRAALHLLLPLMAGIFTSWLQLVPTRHLDKYSVWHVQVRMSCS